MDWIQYILEQENKALTEIYQLHRSDAIIWLANHHQIDEQSGLDIFQQSVITLYHNVHQGKLIKLSSTLKTYLYGIIKVKVKEHRRKSLVTVPVDPNIPSNGTIGISEKLEIERQIGRISNALQQMGGPCKRLLELFYYRQLSVSDIATSMGYKDHTVAKTKKYKCIKRLQSLLNPHKAVTHGD